MSGARHRTAYKFHAKMNKMVTVGDGREEKKKKKKKSTAERIKEGAYIFTSYVSMLIETDIMPGMNTKNKISVQLIFKRPSTYLQRTPQDLPPCRSRGHRAQPVP